MKKESRSIPKMQANDDFKKFIGSGVDDLMQDTC